MSVSFAGHQFGKRALRICALVCRAAHGWDGCISEDRHDSNPFPIGSMVLVYILTLGLY